MAGDRGLLFTDRGRIYMKSCLIVKRSEESDKAILQEPAVVKSSSRTVVLPQEKLHSWTWTRFRSSMFTVFIPTAY